MGLSRFTPFRQLDSLVSIIKAHNFIEHIKCKVTFPIEDISLDLPVSRHLSLILARRRNIVKDSVSFAQRSKAEPLLRYVVKHLFDLGYFEKNMAIIDIGAYLLDNSLPWARLIPQGTVFAVDPSKRNLDFGRKVASINLVNNLEFLQAVCGEKQGQHLVLENNNMQHARFRVVHSKSNSSSIATTLDAIIPEASWSRVGLIHLDVEGMELEVLQGAQSIMCKAAPVIIFESHILFDEFENIYKRLVELNYQVFLINEILKGNAPDCRNFIAFHRTKPVPAIETPEIDVLRLLEINLATFGDVLIPIRL